jgi:hypothetical protein
LNVVSLPLTINQKQMTIEQNPVRHSATVERISRRSSAKASFKKGIQVSSQCTLVMLGFNYLKAYEAFNSELTLVQDGTRLLEVNNLSRFNERFGDYFISGVRTGGEFYGVARIESFSLARQADLAVKIQAGYMAYQASGRVTDELKEEIRNERIAYFHMQRGGLPKTVATIEDLYNARVKVLEEFTGQYAVPYQVTISPYTELSR